MKEYYSVKLTADELIQLDGKVRPEVQAEVNEAKEAKSLETVVNNASEARFIAEVVREAETKGRLVFKYISIHRCDYSGKSAGYAKHKRSGRYHRKGELNFEKPLTMTGVDLAHRCITINGYATLGCCLEFWDAVRSKLAARLEGVKAEIPEEITGHSPLWKWFQKFHCTECGWEGREDQLGKLPGVLGGYYAGECPNCFAQNLIFYPDKIKIIPDQFELLPLEGKDETA